MPNRNSIGASLGAITKVSDLTNPFKKWKPQRKRLMSGKVRKNSNNLMPPNKIVANIENPKLRKEMTLEDLQESRKAIMEKRIELHETKD